MPCALWYIQCALWSFRARPQAYLSIACLLTVYLLSSSAESLGAGLQEEARPQKAEGMEGRRLAGCRIQDMLVVKYSTS